jgi:hypothetical protein
MTVTYLDLSTLKNRKKAVASAINLIVSVASAEQRFRNSMPNSQVDSKRYEDSFDRTHLLNSVLEDLSFFG